jgi:hypothetical protein
MDNIQHSPIQRTVFSKQTYPKVIDTTFKELLPVTVDNSQFQTVDYFFQLYDDLFYEIQPLGEFNSHEALIKRSSDYVGIESRSSDVDALIEEINDLRKQLLEANQTILDLSNKV